MTLNNLIEEAMREVDGVWDDAVESLRKKLRGSKKLFDEVIWPIILISLRYKVRSHDAIDRLDYWNEVIAGDGVSGESHMSEARITALMESTVKAIGSIYNYPLQGGKKLGDAIKSDLEVETDWHDKMARTNGVRAEWFRMIAARLPNAKVTVRKALTEVEIIEMSGLAEGGREAKKPRPAKSKGGRRAELNA